jgi:hypothetical protein
MKKIIILVLVLICMFTFVISEDIITSVFIPGISGPSPDEPDIPVNGENAFCPAIPGPDSTPDCGCPRGYVPSETGETCTEEKSGKSVVYYLKNINKLIVQNKLYWGNIVPVVNKQQGVVVNDSSSKEQPGKEACDDAEICVAEIKQMSDNIEIKEVSGRKVFVAELKKPFLGEQFWIDFSNLEIDYSLANSTSTQSHKVNHKKYTFELVAASRNTISDPIRYLHFSGNSTDSVLDCTHLIDDDTYTRALSSTWADLISDGPWKTLGKAIGVGAGTKAAALTGAGTKFVATKVGLKVFGKILGRVAGPAGFTATTLFFVSNSAAGPGSKPGEAFITKKMIMDLLAEPSTYDCIDEGAPRADAFFRAYEVKLNLIKVDLPEDESGSVKVFFTLDPLKKLGNTKLSSEYYLELPGTLN